MKKAIFYWLILSSFLLAQHQNLTFQITVPDSTDQVYLIGSHMILGNWDHNKAVRLEKTNDTLYTANVQLPINQIVEFKFTRGSWDKEALDKNSSVPQNHSIKVDVQDTVYYTIRDWKDWRSFPMDQVTGSLIIHENVYSPQLDNNRTSWFGYRHRMKQMSINDIQYCICTMVKMCSLLDYHYLEMNGSWMKLSLN